MQGYFKILRLFLVLILGVFFLLGCGDDKPKKDDTKTDTSSQNEGTSNSDNLENDSNQNEDSLDDLTISDNEDSTSANNNQNENNSNSVNIPVEKTEYYEVFAERTIIIDIGVPFEIGSVDYLKSTEHKSFSRKTKVDKENKEFTYSPEGGFVGQEESKYKYWNKDKTNSITITYKIDVKKPLLEGNRDFSITSRCQYDNTYLKDTRIHSFDIDVVDNILNRIENVYDNRKEDSQFLRNLRNPKYSRIAIDYFSNEIYDGMYEKLSRKYHNAFKKNLTKMALVTCNYTNGYLRSILPIASKSWYANKSTNNYDANFVRNDLLFYISLLSELHTQIYLKEYNNSFDRDEALEKADSFMDKIFPNSHYKPEYISPYYESGELSRLERLDYLEEEENVLYYKKLKTLADSITTNRDIIQTLNLIADNYESYYMSGNKECKNSIVCGMLFPEYTQSVTSNSEFKNNLDSWNKIENIDTSIGSGKIDFFPTRSRVAIELSVDRPNSSKESNLEIDIHQVEILKNGLTVDDYFFDFDLDYVHGDTASVFGGYKSSGFSGLYTCFRNSKNEQIGCLSWSDHVNKYYVFKDWGAHIMENTDKFYNIELYPIVRKIKGNLKEGFVEVIPLGAFLKKYLPKIYEQDIKYIEYGMFATEFRNEYGGCVECIAKVIASKINLLKVK